MRLRKTILIALAMTIIATLAVVCAGVVMPNGAQTAQASEEVVLTVTAAGGSVTTYTMSQLQALTNYSGYWGFVNSAGTVTAPTTCTGVALSTVLADAGGMTTLNACDVTATDNYGMTYTYNQAVNGADIQMYNIDGVTKEDPETPVSLVLIWESGGSSLPAADGPLRLVVAEETDTQQIADGHLMVKCVNKVTVRGAVDEWKVKMYGLKRKDGTRQTYTLDRSSYDSCATPGCHGSSWTNPTTEKTWSGVPLFLCIGKVDGGPGHDSYNAYNDALAIKGYRIKLVSTTGKYVIIGSRVPRNRVSIILANKMMGSDLTAKYAPLRLIGPTRYLPSHKWLGRISRITLLPK